MMVKKFKNTEKLVYKSSYVSTKIHSRQTFKARHLNIKKTQEKTFEAETANSF